MSLITAPGNVPLLKALLDYEKSTYGYDIPLIEAPLIDTVIDKQAWAREVMGEYDHVISIEILGAARSVLLPFTGLLSEVQLTQVIQSFYLCSDGGYYNMRGVEASALNAPIDAIFTLARKDGSQVRTISIGDGGNEIGMGNLYELVSKHVPGGSKIGCRVTTDHLITAGVSNWGGYALACALYLIQSHPTLSCTPNADMRMIPDVGVESAQLDVMLANDAVDGPTCAAERKIDSLDFEYHEKMLKMMIALCRINEH